MPYELIDSPKGRYEVLPAEKVSTTDNIIGGAKNLAYGLAKGLADPIYGVSQLALHGVNALTGGKIQDTTNQYDRFLSDVENKYQNDTPGSIPAGAGRFVGNMLYPVKGGGVVRSAAAGGAIGLTQPVFNTPDYAEAKALQVGAGAALGGTLPAIGAGVGALYNTVRPAINPKSVVGDMLARGLGKVPPVDGAGAAPTAAGATGAAASPSPNITGLLGNRNAQDVMDRIANARQLVDGSRPTTAQIAGVPQLVMAEKALSNNSSYKEGFIERANANNSARIAALNSIAKTPEDLTAAIAARKAEADPLYAQAWAQTHNVDDKLGAILQRPSAQQAIARGQKLALERGETALPTPGTPAQPAQNVPTGLLGASGEPLTRPVAEVPATPGTVSGQTLQYLKMGLADLQQEGKRQGMGAHEQSALANTADSLHGWLVDNAPAYKAADSACAAASVPINTMQAGQAVQGALQNRALNSEGEMQPTLTRFNSALNSALKDQPYGIHPDAENVLNGIRSDLQRETVSNSVRSAGSDTAFNMQAPNWLSGKLFGSDLDGSARAVPAALGGLLGTVVGAPTMGAGLGYSLGKNAGEFVGNRVNTEFQKAMLEPEYFSALLRDALARQNGGSGLLGPSINQGAAVSGAQLPGLLSGN